MTSDPLSRPPHRGHGSPYDRGGMDRYYGRRFNPHKRDGTGLGGPNIPLTDPAEIAEYEAGWNDEDDRKDWR